MAFKSVEQFNDDRYHNLFRITEDGKFEDVIFLYRSKADMLVADAVHYVKSADYSGFVHCLGKGCPACQKGLRVQAHLFIPVYVISKAKIEFWDRTMTFEPQFSKDVFTNFPNPSEYVFRITRHGEYRDKDTRYSIAAVGTNSKIPYEAILSACKAQMPGYYENIVKTVSVAELSTMLQTSGVSAAGDMPEYVPVPRAGYQSSIPDTYVNAADAVNVPSETPTLENVDFEVPSDDGLVEIDTDIAMPDPIEGDDMPDPIVGSDKDLPI